MTVKTEERRAAADERHAAVGELAERLKALAHPVRLRILELIARREEMCVCEFEGRFELSQPTISHHVKKLRDAGWITSEADGVRTLHALRADAFEELEGVVGEWRRAAGG